MPGMPRFRLSGQRRAGILRAMKILRFLFHAWAAARTRTELRALSDRALRDIGLERGQIDSLFR